MSPQREIRRYLEELVDRLRRILDAKLVGVYLHGSAALGDFAASRSDIDAIAVVSGGLSDQERARLRDELKPAALSCPATGLEFHVVAASTLADVTGAPLFELHIAIDTKSGMERFVDGSGRDGDPDLVMHYAASKARGVTLLGPPASDVFPDVPRDVVLRALRDELEWGTEHASTTYQVLNAARAWRFVETGEIVSKTEGGTWARSRVDDPAVIDAALAHRSTAGGEHPPAIAAGAFVDAVRDRLA
jgi:streptomycin 3"-adenylyltransferase